MKDRLAKLCCKFLQDDKCLTYKNHSYCNKVSNITKYLLDNGVIVPDKGDIMLIFKDKLLEDLTEVKAPKKIKDIVQGQSTLYCDNENFGCILICAIRYSLGRETYMPKLVMDFIRPLLPYISYNTLFVIMRDIEEAHSYGDERIDKPEWIKFLDECKAEYIRRNVNESV